MDDKKLMVGDGKTKICDLKGITCITASPNGRVYSVEVDDDGNAHATALNLYTKLSKFELYVQNE